MNETITFTGEHLLVGNLGKISIYLSFAAAIFSFLSYFISTTQATGAGTDTHFWRRLGRAGYFVHGTAVFSIFGLLFYIIQHHYFEYQYAWQHSSTELPLRYMISCFWEGQEGSFLLWMTWHVVLGMVLIFTTKKWESPVMAVVALAQIMLTSMLLGTELFGYKLGSNPFNLLRDVMEAPIFSRPNYLQLIADGNGLNPLLQNYWMVIHPPTLFLGFAAAIVPFAFAVAGIWTRDFSGWIKPALPWTLFASMILGAGIIMGGFWAYESLNFGGYWAWDPVENASLLPWLILIATAHTMLIYLKSGKALYTTFLMAIFSFLLVLYATFLTRSGVLGNTSVHSFTDLGMSGQLLIFLFLFLWLPSVLATPKQWIRMSYAVLSVIVLAANLTFGYIEWLSVSFMCAVLLYLFVSIYRITPAKQGAEEEMSSREFWMFIGALVFVISCFHIIAVTSIPVWNKLFGTQFAPAADVFQAYHSVQLPVAIVLGLLIGFTQFFKYKKTGEKHWLRSVLEVAAITLVLTIGMVLVFEISNPLYVFFALAGIFAIVGNATYILKVLKGKISVAGSAVSHIGFGLMLVGVLISSAKKQVISINQTGTSYGDNFDEKTNRENVLLWKNTPVLMGSYEVTYTGDTLVFPNTHYKVQYKGYDREKGAYTGEIFTLMPNAQINPKMGLVANPDTRHYLTHDIFTHVTSVPDKEATAKAPFDNFKTTEMRIGDTLKTNNGWAILERVTPNASDEVPGLKDADFVLTAHLKVITLTDSLTARPVYAIKGDMHASVEAVLQEAGLQFKLANILVDKTNVANTRFVIESAEKPPLQDYIIMKAIIFPYINLLWGGTIVMVIGFLMALLQRYRGRNRGQQKQNPLPTAAAEQPVPSVL